MRSLVHRRVLSFMLATTVLIGGCAVWPMAAHADPEPSVCTINIGFSYAPPISVLPGPTFVTGTMVLNCLVLADDAGIWILPFAGPSGLESCEAGTGAMAWGAGATSPEGAVGPGGGFTYTHGYAGLTAVTGTIPVGPELHTFAATLEWLPNVLPWNCVAPPTPGATATGLATIPLD